MSDAENRSSTTSIRLTPEALERLKRLAYDGERRSDTVMRALDALEARENREAALAEMVRDKRENGEFLIVDFDVDGPHIGDPEVEREG